MVFLKQLASGTLLVTGEQGDRVVYVCKACGRVAGVCIPSVDWRFACVGAEWNICPWAVLLCSHDGFMYKYAGMFGRPLRCEWCATQAGEPGLRDCY